MRMESTIKRMFKTIARQSPPVARKAPIGPGNVQGALTVTLLTKPAEVATQAITPLSNGAMINGGIKIGFKTIGVPKINGSLILKIAGINAVFPSFDPNSDFVRKASKIARPMVDPAPPIQMNHW